VLTDRGHQAAGTPGEQNQFDVLRDGELVFSKQREGRFPEEQEIVGALSP